MQLFAAGRGKKRAPAPAPAPGPAGSPSAGDAVEVRAFERWPDSGLAPWAVKTCARLGFAAPTAVQRGCLRAVLAGRDVIACAQTGSGKTAAFALPILHRLALDPYGVFAVVLTPTRELAVQISEQFSALGSAVGVRVCSVIGGVDMTAQAVELQAAPHVVVATPGRLAAQLRGPAPPRLAHAKFLVLDEADRLLSPSFAPELAAIVAAMPPPARRQTLLFSATMTRSLEELEALALREPFRFDETADPTTVGTLVQEMIVVPAQVKRAYLVELLRDLPEGHSAIVFVATCSMCQQLSELLLLMELPNVALHSVMSQNRRLAALHKFKSSVARLLLCTDVAARGLDIPHVQAVFNFDVPRVPADYIHRVGRTARAGRVGRALTMVTQNDVELVRYLEAQVGATFAPIEVTPYEDRVVKNLAAINTANRVAKMTLHERGFDEMVRERKSRNSGGRGGGGGGGRGGGGGGGKGKGKRKAPKAPKAGKRRRSGE